MGNNAAIPALIILASGVVGFLMAGLIYLLYIQDWIVGSYIQTSADLNAIMGVTVLIWLILGSVLAALSR